MQSLIKYVLRVLTNKEDIATGPQGKFMARVGIIVGSTPPGRNADAGEMGL